MLHTDPATFLIILPNGRVFGQNGTIMTEDNELLADVSMQFGINSKKGNYGDYQVFHLPKIPRPTKMKGSIVVLSTAGTESYYHSLLEMVPRVGILRQCSPEAWKNYDHFVIGQAPPAVREALEQLGVPADKMIQDHPSFHIQASRLIVPSLCGTTGHPTKWACEFLRRSFPPGRKRGKGRKIFISRGPAMGRHVLNREMLSELLEQRGIEMVEPEHLSLQDQIDLFASADLVVAPHGAALTNLLWCKPETHVIELFSPSYVNICFWALCDQLELRYSYLICKGDPLPKHEFDPLKTDEPLEIDLDKLRVQLNKWGVIEKP